MDEQIKMDSFIRTQRITSEAQPTDNNPNMEQDAKHPMDHWRVTLRRPGRKMTVYFSMGSGHHGKEPEAGDVLSCLASDASALDEDFENWCSDLGFDTDSRKAHKTYTVCKRQAERLQKFLGDEAFEQLRYGVEPL